MTTVLASIGSEIRDVVAHRSIRTVFQPLVRLEDRQVIGYEALTRGPRDTALESPDALFAAARAAQLVPELDWACRASALRAALESGLADRTTWFVNVEARALGTWCPEDLFATIKQGLEHLDIVMELTERDLVHNPAGLLATVVRLRQFGLRVALDDVGADPSSLALLPLIEPDVIKLDMRLISRSTLAEVTAIVNAVRAHAESSGALVLAEGIESDHDQLVAETMGATLGQGWLYGRPAELPPGPSSGQRPLPPGEPGSSTSCDPNGSSTGDQTPFEVVAARRHVGLTHKRMLQPISRHLEYQSLLGATPGVLLACFQDAQFYPPAVANRYANLAADAGLTVVYGSHFTPGPDGGIQRVTLEAGDRLADEWNVIVLGAHFAAALVARDLHDDGPDDQRRFEYVVTHDRCTVVEAARSLLSWRTETSLSPAPSTRLTD